MSQDNLPLTKELDSYIRSIISREPEVLRAQREEMQSHPHAGMQSAPAQGQFLSLLARITGAKKTLEVGVFLGYSSTWVALGLPPGRQVGSCDLSEEYTRRARQTCRPAGVDARIELHLGPAL